MCVALAAPPAMLIGRSPVLAYAAFILLGVAGSLFVLAGGIAWARSYGTEGLGKLQGLASSAQIAAAALGPLPLAVSLALTGSYDTGLVLMAAAAVGAGVAAHWWREPGRETSQPARASSPGPAHLASAAPR
jgi:hypothetical protein